MENKGNLKAHMLPVIGVKSGDPFACHFWHKTLPTSKHPLTLAIHRFWTMRKR